MILAFLAGMLVGSSLLAVTLTVGVDAVHAVGQWRRDRRRRHTYRLPLQTRRLVEVRRG